MKRSFIVMFTALALEACALQPTSAPTTNADETTESAPISQRAAAPNVSARPTASAPAHDPEPQPWIPSNGPTR